MQFSEGIKGKYPEIYGSGTSEGDGALSYFEKWGWYATIESLAKGNILKMDKILDKPHGETLVFLAHRIDKQKLEAQLRKRKTGTQTTQL